MMFWMFSNIYSKYTQINVSDVYYQAKKLNQIKVNLTIFKMSCLNA